MELFLGQTVFPYLLTAPSWHERRANKELLACALLLSKFVSAEVLNLRATREAILFHQRQRRLELLGFSFDTGFHGVRAGYHLNERSLSAHFRVLSVREGYELSGHAPHIVNLALNSDRAVWAVCEGDCDDFGRDDAFLSYCQCPYDAMSLEPAVHLQLQVTDSHDVATIDFEFDDKDFGDSEDAYVTYWYKERTEDEDGLYIQLRFDKFLFGFHRHPRHRAVFPVELDADDSQEWSVRVINDVDYPRLMRNTVFLLGRKWPGDDDDDIFEPVKTRAPWLTREAYDSTFAPL